MFLLRRLFPYCSIVVVERKHLSGHSSEILKATIRCWKLQRKWTNVFLKLSLNYICRVHIAYDRLYHLLPVSSSLFESPEAKNMKERAVRNIANCNVSTKIGFPELDWNVLILSKTHFPWGNPTFEFWDSILEKNHGALFEKIKDLERSNLIALQF